ncbi:MAG: ribonuclease H-like domain-containing protein [Phycisphaerales bacterium]|nr:MAG: ribonuclease H-like domain-containing protein [Phycisphaerales bacterium]
MTSISTFCPPRGVEPDSAAAPRLKCYGYLDIETTGLSRQRCDLTVVGVATFRGTEQWVGQLVGEQIRADSVLNLLAGIDEVYTYNGSRFDLPFIRARLGLDLKACLPHTDLMYHCWRRNLKGGLKVVETRLGIRRQLTEVDGYMAVRLWWDYVNNANAQALRTLLDYNKEDVINLHVLREKLDVP